ncbi:hypothetical protein [Neobacillus endophyticus]|nr:hypothetical protein [Neobacillus endophyticus]
MDIITITKTALGQAWHGAMEPIIYTMVPSGTIGYLLIKYGI